MDGLASGLHPDCRQARQVSTRSRHVRKADSACARLKPIRQKPEALRCEVVAMKIAVKWNKETLGILVLACKYQCTEEQET